MPRLTNCQRIVIKVGSALLVNEQNGQIFTPWLQSLAEDVAQLATQGKQVVIVTSGAIALGRCRLNFAKRHLALEEQQAAAASGQIVLAHAYKEALNAHDFQVAQVLLTLGDSESRIRYLNARNTLQSLLRVKAIPIINENDTVATSEICYGDNDRLAARVAQMIDADCLILLSDVEGLYDVDPKESNDAKLIPEVAHITQQHWTMAKDTRNQHGTGGMRTKLAAAEIVMASGCHMVITDGRIKNPIDQMLRKGQCTWFLASTTPMKARKNWIRYHLKPAGTIIIDEGAVNALQQGKSLLAAGVSDVQGQFQKGDPVSIRNGNHVEIARGLSNYSSVHANIIMGHHSSEIETLLGYCGSEEIIHRNDLIMIK